MSATSAEGDGVCLDNGKPISELKVVELRKELETRNLPKSGNKKELYERLRNYLANTGEGNLMASPGRRSASSHSSPVKSPEPVENPMIAKYRASQEQALRAARQEAEMSRATSMDADAGDEESVEQQKHQKIESETSSYSKKSASEENEGSAEVVEPTEPTMTDIAVAEKNISVAVTEEKNVSAEKEDAHSDSGGESTKSFTGELEVGDKKVEEDVKVEDEKSEPTQPEESNREGDDSSLSDNEAGEKETTPNKSTEFRKPSPSSSGSVTLSKEREQGKKVEKEPKVEREKEPPAAPAVDCKIPVEPANVDVGSVVLDTQVELDYEEDEEETESKQNSSTIKPPGESASLQVYTKGVVKVDEPIGSGESKPKISPKEEVTENLTPEGFVRRRPASPARNSLSSLIHIRGLKRPFTVKALQNLLGNFGKLVDEGFWIDSIKSNCIVKFETEEQAQLARERLHNVVWPPSSDLSLMVEFSTDEKLARRRDEGKETAAAPPAASFGLTVTVENSTSKWKDVDAPPRRSSKDYSKNDLAVKVDAKRDQAKSPSRKRKAVAESNEPQKTLEDIFKKTITQPCVYYLPLTDEEALQRAEKKQKERETAAAIKSARNGSERERERENRRRSSPVRQSSGRQRSPERKRDRRVSPSRGYRRH